jgi:ATP-dependent exoDNAse (exonuclease V) alpha subunit
VAVQAQPQPPPYGHTRARMERGTYTHAHTGHSLQGTSVSSGITIFDLGHPFMTRAWLYTALTRSRSMDQV